MSYYSLIVRHDADSTFAVEFGAWEIEDVEAERQNYRDNGTRAAHVRIITTDGTQAEIDAKVARINLALAR